MKILCKLKPTDNDCCCCISDQWDGYKKKLDCDTCLDRMPDYEILQFGHGLFGGDWAIVLDTEGHVTRVKLDRVKRVKTLHDIKGTACHGSAIHDIRLKNV